MNEQSINYCCRLFSGCNQVYHIDFTYFRTIITQQRDRFMSFVCREENILKLSIKMPKFQRFVFCLTLVTSCLSIYSLCSVIYDQTTEGYGYCRLSTARYDNIKMCLPFNSLPPEAARFCCV